MSGELIASVLFYVSPGNITFIYEYVTIAGEGLQNFDLFSALLTLEHMGAFIVPRLLWHKASVFAVSF